MLTLLFALATGKLITSTMEDAHERRMSTPEGRKARSIVNAVLNANTTEEYHELLNK